MDDPYRHIPELDGPIEHVYYRESAAFLRKEAYKIIGNQTKDGRFMHNEAAILVAGAFLSSAGALEAETRKQ